MPVALALFKGYMYPPNNVTETLSKMSDLLNMFYFLCPSSWLDRLEMTMGVSKNELKRGGKRKA